MTSSTTICLGMFCIEVFGLKTPFLQVWTVITRNGEQLLAMASKHHRKRCLLAMNSQWRVSNSQWRVGELAVASNMGGSTLFARFSETVIYKWPFLFLFLTCWRPLIEKRHPHFEECLFVFLSVAPFSLFIYARSILNMNAFSYLLFS